MHAPVALRWALTVLAVLALQLPHSSQPLYAADTVAVTGLTAERQAAPLGLGEAPPRLGWQLRSSARGTTQSAYQVQGRQHRRRLILTDLPPGELRVADAEM